MKIKLFRRNKKKAPEKITTVNDILTNESVRILLEKVIAEQADITDLVVIYQTRNNEVVNYNTPDSTIDRIVYLMEQAKYWTMNGDNE